jgi:hypothetical protein
LNGVDIVYFHQSIYTLPLLTKNLADGAYFTLYVEILLKQDIIRIGVEYLESRFCLHYDLLIKPFLFSPNGCGCRDTVYLRDRQSSTVVLSSNNGRRDYYLYFDVDPPSISPYHVDKTPETD